MADARRRHRLLTTPSRGRYDRQAVHRLMAKSDRNRLTARKRRNPEGDDVLVSWLDKTFTPPRLLLISRGGDSQPWSL